MSNKSQLQTNNIDLQSILSTVLGLPTQESVKHGAYVWKKCATNYTESSTSKAGTVILVSNAQKVAIKAYYSTAYTFDNTTGHFELSNPTEITVGYGEGYTFSNGNMTKIAD